MVFKAINMKQILVIWVLFSLSTNVYTQENATWQIVSDERIEDYYPATVANGMIGILPAQQPLQIDKVVLNGVYDVYGRGEGVSNIVQGIDFLSIDIVLNKHSYLSRVRKEDITNWQQVVDMKKAEIITTFTWIGKVDIEIRKSFKGSESAGLDQTSFQHIGPERIPVFSVKGHSPTGKHTLAAANCFLVKGDPHPHFNYHDDGYRHQLSLDKQLPSGKTFELAVVGAVCSSAHFTDPANEANRLALFAYFEGVETLRKRHYAAWDKLWESDIIIEGNEEDQRNVRFALYNLYSFARKGTDYSIGPMGLSGIGYNGHIFWDCEIWMYPPLLILQPEIAHSLLEYRYNRLGAAKEKAFNHGYDGAMFPWESAESGSEETPFGAITGPLEHHISADIAIAFWNYFLVTKDQAWLRTKGYEVIREVADFWVSRVELNEKGEYEINRVVGADEFAENVNNNAFTNGSAIVALRAATKAAQILGLEPNLDWEEVANNIPIRFFEDGTTMVYENYSGVTIKQADVNLLSYPLGLLVEKDQMKKNLDYYSKKVFKYTPAMTHSIYSIISNMLGDSERAYDYFIEAHHPNLRAPFGVLSESRNSGNPYFATGAGGLLQAVLNGFGGLRITENGVEKTGNTQLPQAWDKLIIKGVGREDKTFVVNR